MIEIDVYAQPDGYKMCLAIKSKGGTKFKRSDKVDKRFIDKKQKWEFLLDFKTDETDWDIIFEEAREEAEYIDYSGDI
ncbi:MAG: hypothetical protein ACYC97_09730 [Metallibacterium sp.]